MKYGSALVGVSLMVLATLVPQSTTSGSLGPVQPLYLDDTVSCTAFSVNKKDRLWVTAGHCTTQEGVTTLGIGAANALALVVRRDEIHDLALLQGGIPTTALDLADHMPQTGDTIETQGYPIGSLHFLSFFGRLSSARFVFPGETEEVAVFDSQSLPGMSGSPIRVHGRVIGVFSGIYRGKVGQIAWGSTWARLKEFVGPSWDGE